MRGEQLGELEELVLLTVGSLYEKAYAVAILEEIVNNTSRKMDVTAIHSVLRRLEKKGFVKHRAMTLFGVLELVFMTKNALLKHHPEIIIWESYWN